MFDIITKREFWEWDDAGLVDRTRLDLKGIQDAYVLDRLADARGKRILEVGGGNSRVLKILGEPDRGNECWNAEKFEGFGNGPRQNANADEVRVANCYLGDFDPILPDGYFDYVFSVSVVEHVPTEQLEVFFADSARVLKTGGQLIHAIDLYVFDSGVENARRSDNRIRLEKYRSFGNRPDLGLRFVSDPTITEDVVDFRCAFATNTDLAMNQWNRSVPGLRPIREIAQSVSIKAEWVKDGMS